MAKKYILNVNTRKIHRIDGCYMSNNMKPQNTIKYYTIEEARAEAASKYSFGIKLCGSCFEKKEKENMEE